jgi:hypothetical protein
MRLAFSGSGLMPSALKIMPNHFWKYNMVIIDLLA